jgi:hypothetical protein
MTPIVSCVIPILGLDLLNPVTARKRNRCQLESGGNAQCEQKVSFSAATYRTTACS